MTSDTTMSQQQENILEDTSGSTTSDQSILTVAKGGGISFIGTLLEYAGRFILGFLLARLMGDAQYGLYSVADSAFYIVVGIALLGLNTGTTHFVSMFVSQRDQEGLWRTIQIGLGLPLIVSLLGGLLCLAFATPMAEIIFHEPELAPLLRIVALAIPAGTLAASASFVLLGFKRLEYSVLAKNILQTYVKLFLIIVLAITGLTAIKAMTVYSIGAIVSCGLLIYFVNKLFPLNRPLDVRFQHVRRMLHFSLPVYLSEILTMLGPNLRILLLGALSTVASAGVFTVASRVSMVSTAFYTSISVMSMPVVSELHAAGDLKDLKRFFQTMTKWTLTFSLPFFLLILFFSRPILSVFGDSYVSGSLGLIILASNDLFSSAVGICGVMVTMTGNTKLNILNAAIRFILLTILSVVLIPRWGVVGAATATTISLSIVNFILVLEVFLLFRILPYNRSFAKPVSAALLSFLSTYVLTQWVFSRNSLVGAVVSAGTLLITYISTILLLGLSEEDQVVVNRFQERVSRIPVLSKLFERMSS